MASANSLKEPSMDEILASIRRIIESGDERSGTGSAAAKDGAPSLRPTSDLSPKSDIETSGTQNPTSRSLPDVPRFDVHYLKTAPGATVAEESQNSNPAVEEEAGDASVASSKMSAGADWQAGRSETGETEAAFGLAPMGALDLDDRPTATPMPGNENFAQPSSSPEASNAQAAPADDSFELDDRLLEAELRDGSWGAEAPTAAAAEPEASESQLAPSSEARTVRPIPESVIDGASALLSAEAGDQVASAFGDLARAIREGQMRSMEQMAKEMLRPMLQEWLDDNLPRIVERLVREEIERVARGARY